MAPDTLTAGSFATIAVTIVLFTIAAMLIAFALLGDRLRHRDVFYSGVLAAVYALRMAARSSWLPQLIGHDALLEVLAAELEYVAPVAGALAFLHIFGNRWRLPNRIALFAFAAVAVIAIPFELATGRIGLFLPAVNALVVLLIVVVLLNLMLPDAGQFQQRLLRAGALVFGLFVLNQHFRVVAFASEPLGFLVFMVTIGIVTMRTTLRDQQNLVVVQTELQTARRIQMSLIPAAPPRVEGLELSAFYRPASEVGGDFYDFAEREGRVAVFVADVSGHGVPAALLASMLKIAFATEWPRSEGPGSLLLRLNELFCGRMERQFVTAACVEIDTTSWTARVATAGHPPVLLLDTNGLRELATRGPVIGRFRSIDIEEREVALEPGATLVLYTDGLTEARNQADELWGEERLCGALQRSLAFEGIVNEAQAWSGGFEDDVTLVGIRRAGKT